LCFNKYAVRVFRRALTEKLANLGPKTVAAILFTQTSLGFGNHEFDGSFPLFSTPKKVKDESDFAEVRYLQLYLPGDSSPFSIQQQIAQRVAERLAMIFTSQGLRDIIKLYRRHGSLSSSSTRGQSDLALACKQQKHALSVLQTVIHNAGLSLRHHECGLPDIDSIGGLPTLQSILRRIEGGREKGDGTTSLICGGFTLAFLGIGGPCLPAAAAWLMAGLCLLPLLGMCAEAGRGEEKGSAPISSVFLDTDRCFSSPDNRYFYRGVDFFNRSLVGKNPISWGNIISLFERFRGDDINPRYTPQIRRKRLRSIAQHRFINFQHALQSINQKWPTTDEALSAAARVYTMVVGTSPESQLFVEHSFGVYGCLPLPGFDKVHELSDRERLGHCGVGHHRLGWFLLNYVLWNNGLSPLYLTREEAGAKGPFGTCYVPADIIRPLKERVIPLVSVAERNPGILKIYQFFLS